MVYSFLGRKMWRYIAYDPHAVLGYVKLGYFSLEV